MTVTVSEFKAKCTAYIRQVHEQGEPIEVTRNGTVVAVVSAPPLVADSNPAWGLMRGSVTYIADDFDEPAPEDWEAMS